MLLCRPERKGKQLNTKEVKGLAKPKYPQSRHTVEELLPYAEHVFKDPILATLAASGLPPSVLDRYAKEILGWPNELCRCLRDAAYLYSQHPKEWQRYSQIEVKESETKVITPLSGGSIPLYQLCIDQSRRLSGMFTFALDQRLSQIKIDGETNHRLLVATQVKVGNRRGKLTHPLLLRQLAVKTGGKLITTIDGKGTPSLWHGHQDDAYGLWQSLTSHCNGEKSCGSLEYNRASGWNWNTDGSDNLTEDGILVMFDRLIEDRDIDYGRHGSSHCSRHKVPRFTYKVILQQHVSVKKNIFPVINKVIYRGYFDNHPTNGCTDGLVVFERRIPFGDQSVDRPKCLVVQAVYENVCHQCGNWKPSLLDIDGFRPCIKMDNAGTKFK